MESFKKIEAFLNSPSIKLIQKENAVLILGFIYSEFKEKERNEIAKFELTGLLENYISELHKQGIEKFLGQAKDYIETWQKDENPYLQTLYFHRDTNDWMIEPTINVKKVFQWVDEIGEQTYYGTEVGFLNILNTMKNIVFGTLIDPEEKLKKLNDEKNNILKQIESIQNLMARGEKIEQIDSHEIKSKYSIIVRDSKRLVHDFEEIASKYKRLKSDIKDKYNIEKLSRGAVLGTYLDTDKKLQENPLVKSYKAFRNYLRPQTEDQLEELLSMIHQLPEVKPITDRFVSRLSMHLGQASKKVSLIDSEIFSWVKTIFDEKYQENAKMIYALTQEIKKLILENKSRFPALKQFIEVETSPELYIDRYPFLPTTRVKFGERVISNASEDGKEEILSELRQRFVIDEEEIKERLNELVALYGPLSLSQVVKHQPIEKGLPEVAAYIKLAAGSSAYKIDNSTSESIPYEGGRFVDVPLITFINELG
jgi:hypothetical protein